MSLWDAITGFFKGESVEVEIMIHKDEAGRWTIGAKNGQTVLVFHSGILPDADLRNNISLGEITLEELYRLNVNLFKNLSALKCKIVINNSVIDDTAEYISWSAATTNNVPIKIINVGINNTTKKNVGTWYTTNANGTLNATLRAGGDVTYKVLKEGTNGSYKITNNTVEKLILNGLKYDPQHPLEYVSPNNDYIITNYHIDSDTAITVVKNDGYNLLFGAPAKVIVANAPSASAAITGSTGGKDTISVGGFTLSGANLTVNGGGTSTASSGDDADIITVNDLTVSRGQKLVIDGQAGNDSITVNNVAVNGWYNTLLLKASLQVYGGDGDDEINVGDVTFGNVGAVVTIDGNDGNDSINLFNVNAKEERAGVSIYGGNGNDTVSIDQVQGVYLDLGNGDDLVTLSADNSYNNNHNSIVAAAGNNTIDFSRSTRYVVSDNYISLGDGDDFVKVGPTADGFHITVGGGNNTVELLGSNHTVDASKKVFSTETLTNKIDVYSKNSSILGALFADAILVDANEVTVNANDGNDSIKVSANSGNSNIDAGLGNDTIIVEGGLYHTINAGNGKNYIQFDGRLGSISAGSGNDTITINGKNNTVNAGDGDNVITISEDYNNVTAGTGADTITVSGKNNTVNANAGADVVTVSEKYNKIDAGAGNDSVVISGNYNAVTLGAGNDTVTLAAKGRGNSIDATDGADVISIGSGNKELYITSGSSDNDTIKIANTAGFRIFGLDKTDVLDFSSRSNITARFVNNSISIGGSLITIYQNDSTSTVKSLEDLYTNNLYDVKVFYNNGESATTLGALFDNVYGWYVKDDNKTSIYYGGKYGDRDLITISGVTLTDDKINNLSRYVSLSESTTKNYVTLSQDILNQTSTVTMSFGDNSKYKDNTIFDAGNLTQYRASFSGWAKEEDGSKKTVFYAEGTGISGYSVSETKIAYATADKTGNVAFEISGLSGEIKEETDKSYTGITRSFDDKTSATTITLTAGVMGTNTDEIKIVGVYPNDKYSFKLALADGTTAPTNKNNLWTVNTGTDDLKNVVYTTGGKTAGYELDADSQTITYTAATPGATVFEIIGLDKSVTAADGGSENAPDNISLANSTITITNAAALNSDSVVILTGNTNYKLALSESVVQPSTNEINWATETLGADGAKSGVVIYKNQDTLAGYTLGEDSKMIVYNESVEGAGIFEIYGLSSGVKLNDTTKTVDGVALGENSTITLSKSVLNNEDVYLVLEDENSGYNLKLANDVGKVSVGDKYWGAETYEIGGKKTGIAYYNNGDSSSGYTRADSTMIAYTESVAGAAIFAIDGLNSEITVNGSKTIEGVTFDGATSTIKLTEAALNKEDIYLTVFDDAAESKYSLTLDSAIKGSETVEATLTKNTTDPNKPFVAYMSEGIKEGYDAVAYDSENSIAAHVEYTKGVASEELFRIKGIDASKVKTEEDKITGLEFLTGDSATTLIITDGNLLAGSDIMLTNSGGDSQISAYNIQLSDELAAANESTLISGYMTVEGGKVGYIASRSSDGYFNAGSYVYHIADDGPQYGFKLAGLSNTSTLDSTTLKDYVTLTEAKIDTSGNFTNTKITISTSLLGDSNVTLSDVNTLVSGTSYIDFEIKGEDWAPRTLDAYFTKTSDTSASYVSYYSSNTRAGYTIISYANNVDTYEDAISDTWTFRETETSIVYNSGTKAQEVFKVVGLDMDKISTASDTDSRQTISAAGIEYDSEFHIVTVTKDYLNRENVSIRGGDGKEEDVVYSVTLAESDIDTMSVHSIPVHWDYKNADDDETDNDTTTVVYYGVGYTEGYTVSDSIVTAANDEAEATTNTYIAYSESVHGASEAAITGLNLSSDAFTDIKVSGSFITMRKSVLDTRTGSEVSLTSSKYSFTLADDAKIKTTVESWAANNGNVTYKEEHFSEGYALGEDNMYIEHKEEKGGAEIKISGLATTTKKNSQNKVSGIEIEDSGNTRIINISAALLAEQDVTLSSTSKQYTYKLATDAESSTTRTDNFWITDAKGGVGSAIYYDENGSYTAGYKANDSGTAIIYDSGVNLTSITRLEGLKANVTTKVRNYDTEITGITVKDSAMTIASTLINSDGLTIKGGSYDGDEKFKSYALGGKAQMYYFGTDAVSLIGSAGNDSITNSGTAVTTIDGGRGNDVIIAGSKGDYIIADAGNDSISLGGGKDTIEYSAGKVVIQNFAADDLVDIGKLNITKSGYNQNTKDLTLNIGTGSLTFKGVGETEIVTDNKIYSGYYIYNSNKTAVSFSTGADSAPTIAASVVTVDAANYASGLNITGNSNNNYISGTKRNDTITSGYGSNTISAGVGADSIYSRADSNNLITGGAGNDTIFFAGGVDTITDYGTGKDVITLASGIEYTDAEIYVNDLTLTFGTKGSIVLENAAHKLITINGEGHYYEDHAIISSKKNFASLSAAATTFDASTSFSSLVTVDGSAATVSTGVKITGNAKANVIKSGTRGGVLNGGKGNDTLIGGAGNDLFVYTPGEGKDVIQNYGVSGSDAISITGDSGFEAIVNSAISGTDLVLTVNKQTLTVKDVAKDSTTATVNINGENYTFGDGYYMDSNKQTATMYAGFRSKFNEDGSNTSVRTINAAASKYATTITGNDAANTITGGTKADSIYGGSGNDWIEGGAGNDVLNGGPGDDTLSGGPGNDTFEYTFGEGDDSIMDYTAGKDKIRINGGTVSDYKVVKTGETVQLTISSTDTAITATNTLTVNFEGTNAKNRITTIENGKTTTKNYLADSKRTLDLMYDNNFTSEEFTLDDISSVSDTKYAVGSIKTTDTNALIPDETALTYGDDDKK